MKINGNLIRFNLSLYTKGWKYIEVEGTKFKVPTYYDRPEDVPYYRIILKNKREWVQDFDKRYTYNELIEYLNEVTLPKNHYIEAYPRKSTKTNNVYNLSKSDHELLLINKEGLIVAIYDTMTKKLTYIDEDYKKYKKYFLRKIKDYIDWRMI